MLCSDPSRTVFPAAKIARWLLTVAICGLLPARAVAHDPVILNHMDAPLVVFARLDGKEQRYEIAAKHVVRQEKAGRQLSGLRIVDPDKTVRDYDGKFLNVMRANISHSSELWVIEPIGINLKNVGEVDKWR